MAIDGSIIKVEVGNTSLRGMFLFSCCLEFVLGWFECWMRIPCGTWLWELPSCFSMSSQDGTCALGVRSATQVLFWSLLCFY